jgi:AraC family transcriptional regulator of adaptative response/methylated-DNA-[protein]-cysteine methyltransferase
MAAAEGIHLQDPECSTEAEWHSVSGMAPATTSRNQTDDHHPRDAGSRDDARWHAIVRRDAGADGTFWYSVRTTGIYCRPSCGARRPRRENVRFHDTAGDAERAGFRACKRCRPDQRLPPARDAQHAAVVIAACRTIERSASTPRLDRLARQAGLSPHQFHRLFTRSVGVTPSQYAAAHRHARTRTELERSTTVTQAMHDAGFNSSGRFYAHADAALGMTPLAYRAGGAGVSIRFAVGDCSLGSVLVADTSRGICAILLGDDPVVLVRELQDRFPRASFVEPDRAFERTVSQVVALVDRPAAGLSLPLDVRGTAFQQRVWQALREIPAGSTASYTEIAARIGAPRAVRGVARACASNPIAVAIPCHRVVRRDGDLAGYRWGIHRKRALLEKEDAL